VRVVAGSAKGIRLAPVPKGVRPVSDMAREGVFSSLGTLVPGARVLDLYAGTGAMGIEALSRGAEHGVLVERDRGAVRVIRDNLERTGLAERAEVVVTDVSRFVTRDDKNRDRFDLVIADPPYEAPVEEVEGALAALAEGWLAGAGSRLVLTRPSRSSTLVIPVHFCVARRLTYGDTLVLIIREA
jgi:16S rRNA (guanine966-N2)-methyltransferase